VIPILDLTEQYLSIKTEIDAAVAAVLGGGHYIMGPNVKALEEEIAEYVGSRHAVALNSGTDSLHLALRALDIGAGDEVITSPFTFVATTEAIGIVGARPVFVDIDPVTFALDPALIESAITPRTKAILPVHLYGFPASMHEIVRIARRHGLFVVEDCAQAIGATIQGRHVGTMGDIGCFSFFPSKNLGAYGDGGMLTTDSEQIAERVRMLRAHGGRVKYHHEALGINSRLDELQAAILRVKLPYLEHWIAAREAVAERYGALRDIDGITLPTRVPGIRHVFHQYTVRAERRDDVRAALDAGGIQTMIYYPVPLHLQRVHRDLGYVSGSFPVAEQAAAKVLSLPMYPELSTTAQETVCTTLRAHVDLMLA
jgi:dTDP-4-amino-4,6-dideoxygalactose transaminase